MKKLVPKTTFCLYFTVFAALVKAKSVTFYDEKDITGTLYSVEFEGLQCYNIQSYFSNQSSSVVTYDNCIFAYEENDCQGRHKEILTPKRKYLNLGDIDFDDKISSFRQCDNVAFHEDVCDPVKVEVDYSKAPDLKNVTLKMKQTIEELYPSACRFLWSPLFKRVRVIKLYMEQTLNGVADVIKNNINADPNYFRSHPDDMGTIVAVMTTVIQQYLKQSGCPTWLRGAIAYHVKNKLYGMEEPEKPSDSLEFEDSSEVSSEDMLKWLDERWPNTIYQLNRSCREGPFDHGLLQRITGKNDKQLVEEKKRGC